MEKIIIWCFVFQFLLQTTIALQSTVLEVRALSGLSIRPITDLG